VTTGEQGSRRRLSVYLGRRPLLTAVVYTGTGVLPLFVVSAQILQLERDLGFGVSRLGIATTTFFGFAAAAATPAGRFVARRGSRRGLRAGASLTIVACLLAGATPVWWVVPVAMALGGVANGLIQVAGNLAIFDGVITGRQGLAFGAKQASVPMASMLAGISLPLIGLIFGWRWVFVAAAAPAAVLAISAPPLDTTRFENRDEGSIKRLPGSLLLLVLAGLSGAAAGNGIALFVVPSAVDIGIDEAAAGTVLAVCSVLVVAVRIGAGQLVDRKKSSGHIEMSWMTGAGVIGALALMLAPAPSAYLVALPLALLGTWGWPGVFFYTVVNTYPEYPAKASGVFLSSNLTGTLIGPLMVGTLAGRGDYSAAWLFVALAAAVSTLALLSSYRISSRTGRVTS
jgi:MFS family permease